MSFSRAPVFTRLRGGWHIAGVGDVLLARGRQQRQKLLVGVVADAPGADGAGFQLLPQRAGNLAGLRVRVEAVEIIEVDVVRAEPLQAAAQLHADGLGRGVLILGGLANLHAELGRHDVVLAGAGDGLADDLLGDAAVGARIPIVPLIHVGGVNKIDALVMRIMHKTDGVRLRDGAAEGHGAEADLGDFQVGAGQTGI
jgi:hypothetical protein